MNDLSSVMATFYMDPGLCNYVYKTGECCLEPEEISSYYDMLLFTKGIIDHTPEEIPAFDSTT
ncbi:MAG: hypothetical protein SVZ03_11515 [Spirochaetota bacterium]|nr:hypothetical protein [Spirochaetota bacterium]